MRAVVCCMSSGNGPSLGKIAHVPAAASSVASPSPTSEAGAVVATPTRCASMRYVLKHITRVRTRSWQTL